METRKCKNCGEEYQLTNEYFRPEKSNKTGWSYKCRECISEYGKKYYEQNKEKMKENALNRHYEKREELLQYKKSYREKNRDILTKRSRDWYRNNKEHWKSLIKQYQQNNPEKLREYERKRNQNKKHEIKNGEWKACKEYFNYECAYCGISEELHRKEYKQQLHKEHVDHNGANDLSNCVPACKSCNSHKNVYGLGEWYNESNDNFTQERLIKIHNWLNEDYIEYIN